MPDPIITKDRTLQDAYDFIVCGAGSSGSVVASRLSESADVSVLLIEAGGDDNVPAVLDPSRWASNIGGERDWCFRAAPNPALHYRSTEYAMGKVFGGGSSINALAWVHGHKEDWDYIAHTTLDPRWNDEAIRVLYRSIEAWQGLPDEHYRGQYGPVVIGAAQNASPIADALLEAGRANAIPRVTSYNGRARRFHDCGALTELIIRNGARQSVFRSYLPDADNRPNLTLLPDALVTKVRFDGPRATGVDLLVNGRSISMVATREVILSLGAIQTPKILMQSGIGEARILENHGIPVKANLPGVGRNLQDHACFDVLFEYAEYPSPKNNLAEALLFARSRTELTAPDLLIVMVEAGKTSPELTARFSPPPNCWALRAALLQPESRGRVMITGPDPSDPVHIETGFLNEAADLTLAARGIRLCQQLGHAAPLARYRKCEVLPGHQLSVEEFARNGCVTFHHQTCTAKMGTDALSVVDSELRVYGIEHLRIADGSVFPKITRGNTMAPCVVVGERAARLLQEAHGLHEFANC